MTDKLSKPDADGSRQIPGNRSDGISGRSRPMKPTASSSGHAASLLAAIAAAFPASALAQGASGPWRVSSIGTSQQPACDMTGAAGPGELSLTILGSAPGYIHLQLDKPSWSIRPAGQVRIAMTFAGAPGVSLAGDRGGAASVLAMLTANDLPAWMHGFTAAQSATISFPGTTEPPWTFDLNGTTAAVNALQKCVLENRIAGVPPPFKSIPVQPVVTAADHCLRYDPAVATIAGTVRMATGYGPPGFGESPTTDPKFQYAELVPDRPVCVTGGAANHFDDVKGIKSLELFLPDHGKIFDAQPWLGRHVVVVGEIDQQQHASESATEVYANVNSIRPSR